jgi:hypothetical protein
VDGIGRDEAVGRTSPASRSCDPRSTQSEKHIWTLCQCFCEDAQRRGKRELCWKREKGRSMCC